MSHKGPANPDRSFGVSVGGVLLAVAAFLWWRGRITGAAWSGAIGAVLLLLGLIAPKLLKWPSALWWKLAMALGYVNARVILTIAFLLVLTPIAFIWRAIADCNAVCCCTCRSEIYGWLATSTGVPAERAVRIASITVRQ